ncbi:hypothetical protein EYR40_003215 [Pleurotus pulmonarius]|nr:hypothetical protein EYR40_003215 [Pleurotus pulmonarius]
MSATMNGTKESIYRSIFVKYGIAPDFYSELMKDIEDKYIFCDSSLANPNIQISLYDLVAATTYDAASEIARNDNKWDTWCESMHATTNQVESFVSPSVMAELEAVAATVRYPSKLRNLSEFRQEVSSLGKHNKFLDGIAEWAKSSHSWDDTLNPDVLHLYSAWCITLEALQAGSCELAACTAPEALLHTIFAGGPLDESRHTMYTEIDVLLPVMLDSPYPIKKARADTCFGMVLPKDVKHQIELACFANGSMAYTRSLRCMDTQGPAIVLGTFFAEWNRSSANPQAARPPTIWLTPFVMQQFQQSDAHSWDLREPSALVECFYFILALKKTVDANLQKDVEELRQRDDAALIDWNALRKRQEDWRRYDEGRSKTAKIKRLKAARRNSQGGNRDTKDPAHGGCSTDGKNESTNVDRKSDDNEMDPDESSSDVAASDPEEHDAKFVSILSWRHGKEYPVKDRDAWYRDPESLKLLDDV